MGRPRKAAGKTENQKKTKTIRGYIIREDKIAFDEDAVFSEEDDDFDFASKSVKKIPVNKTKGKYMYVIQLQLVTEALLIWYPWPSDFDISC